MTARDFTPTDEQVEALCATDFALDADNVQWEDCVIKDAWRADMRSLIASPAFQSIIAAAKAEALRDLADEYRRSMKFATDHRIDAGLMILHIEKRANEFSEASA